MRATPFGEPSLRIGKARLSKAGPGDRGLLLAALEEVDPQRIGIGPAALLIVPRLKAPHPLRRDDRSGGFARGVTTALRAAAERARGVAGEGRGSSPLLFRDHAEAAAALILAWLGGPPPSERAWWPLVTCGAEPRAWWRHEILPDARLLATVMARLASTGAAATWVGRLEDAEVEIAVGALASACGLAREVAEAFAPPPPPAAGGQRSKSPRAAHEAAGPEPSLRPDPGSVLAAVPEAVQPTLRPRGRALLLLALLSHRRPDLLPTRAAEAALRTALRPDRAAAEQALPPGGDQKNARRPSAGRARAVADQPVRNPALPIETPATPSALKASAAGGASIESSFGGLFFLLNAFTALGLYGEFTRPRQALPGLSPFALLHMLGRRWWSRAFAADPLSALLVELAGGRRAASGADFEAPAWSVPAAWLAPWPNPSRAPRRHPAGFPLCQPPPATAARARRLWLNALACYLDARIAAALGTQDRRGGCAFLCSRSATVTDDGDGLHVTFALEDHPLEIRLAGLDRDPGRLAGAIRDVGFEFA